MRLSRDGLKHVALFAMVLNHAAQTFLPHGGAAYYLLVYAGYMTAPMMCYFLVQGFYATRSRKKYALRLLVFGVLSQPIYGAWHWLRSGSMLELNMMFTLFVCFLVLSVRNAKLGPVASLAIQAALVVCTFRMTWSYVAAIETVLFDMARAGGAARPERRRAYGVAAFAGAGALVTFMQVFVFGVPDGQEPFALACFAFVMLAGVLVLYGHDGEKDDASKRTRFRRYYFYVFYPAHLAVLVLARVAIG